MEYFCKDCRYYLPVDVFRGICKISKEKILPDDSFCKQAERLAKCKFCQHYVPGKEFLGNCADQVAYPDMVAAKCADFKWFS